MQLNNLESAWRQLKLLNTMDYIGPKEIHSIIEHSENMKAGKLQRVFLNMIMFIVLTIICQSG